MSKATTEGETLLLWRREQGLSQAELGDLLGRTRQTVANWEAGKTRLPKGFWPRVTSLVTVAAGAKKAVSKERAALIKRECDKYRNNYHVLGGHDAVIADWTTFRMGNGMTVVQWYSLPENADILAALEETRKDLENGKGN